MTAFPFPSPAGVIAACVAPFDEDYALDEAELRRHVRHVAATPGLAGIAQAGEGECLSFAEDERVLDIVAAELGGRLPMVASIYGEGREAVRTARMAEARGASAFLVYPPKILAMGGQLRPEVALAHHKMIADASPLPIILYQFPAHTGLNYSFETILRLIDEVPSVGALKDLSNDPALHQRLVRTLQRRPRPINVLSAHSVWLMASLLIGCNGLCSSVGSLVTDLQVTLWRAVQAEDLRKAREINEQLVPITQALYEPPGLDLHNRTKEALVALGRLKRAVVRPPLVKLPQPEIDRLRKALRDAGLAAEGPVGAGRLRASAQA